MEFEFGGRTFEVDATMRTLVLYEQHFGGADMIGDLFDVVRVERPKKRRDDAFEIDYRSVPWTACTRALWACAKTADDGLPPYKKWVAGFEEPVNMWDVATRLREFVQERLFHAGATDSD